MSELENERLWCVACGTVTRNRVCDCNRYGDKNCEPNFVNYADELQKHTQQLDAELAAVRKQLEQERKTMDVLESNARMQAHLLAGIGRERDALRKQLAKRFPSREQIAIAIWAGEYRRATGKERSIGWDGVSEEDANKYLFLADAILALTDEEGTWK